jgi:hypothetical protein
MVRALDHSTPHVKAGQMDVERGSNVATAFNVGRNRTSICDSSSQATAIPDTDSTD